MKKVCGWNKQVCLEFDIYFLTTAITFAISQFPNIFICMSHRQKGISLL